MQVLRKWASIVLVIIGAAACEQQSLDGTEDLDSGSARESLNDLSFQVHNDIVGMLTSNGVKALTDLLDLMPLEDAFSGRVGLNGVPDNELFKAQLEKFKSIFIPTSSVQFFNQESQGFDFQSNVGIYEWDQEIEMFVRTAAELDHIQINFPLENSGTNNASLRILNFEEQGAGEEGASTVFPIAIVANLLVDEVLQASLSYEASLTEVNAVEAAKVRLFIAPFDYSLAFEAVTPSHSKLTTSIFRDDLRISNSSFLISFNPELKSEVVLLEGELAYGAHLVSGTIDFKGVNGISPDDDANEFIDLAFFDNGKKIGEFLLVRDALDDNSYDPYILYEDGSKELLSEAFITVLDEIENFILEVEGEV